MFYPEDFKKRVKSAYPNWGALHEKLDSGDEFVGRYLNDSMSTDLPISEILSATSLEELQEKARLAQVKVDLYAEWGGLYDKQFKLENPHHDEAKFFILMKNAFHQLPETIGPDEDCISVDKENVSALDFYLYISENEEGNEKYEELKEFLEARNMDCTNDDFLECFWNVQQEWVKEHAPRFNLNALVVDESGHRGRVLAYEPGTNKYLVDFIDPENFDKDGWYHATQLFPYVHDAPQFKEFDLVVDDTGRRGKVLDYAPATDEYRIHYDDGNVWWASAKTLSSYVPKAIKSDKVENVGSLLARATTISEQSKGLAEELGKIRDSSSRREHDLLAD